VNINNLFYDLYEEDKKERNKIFLKIGEQVFNFFQETALSEGYEDREGQWDMACDVVDGIGNKQHVLVEAGVGIGKSFAYIVPVLYFHRYYKKPIIIATSTIALQEQLVGDLQIIENLIGYHVEVLIAKGQNHFLCRDRFINYFTKELIDIHELMYKEILASGHEKADWKASIPDNIWNAINVKEYNQKYCKEKCAHTYDCYYYQLRFKMLSTEGVIVCNQDLLAVNMHKRSRDMMEMINPKVKLVIIDEVHNLESRVRNSVTENMTYQGISNAIEGVRKAANVFGSDFSIRAVRANNLLNNIYKAFQKQIDVQKREKERLGQDVDRFSVDVNIKELQGLCNEISEISMQASIRFEDIRYASRNVDYELEQLQIYQEFLESMIKKERSDDIFWMVKGNSKNNITIFKCPKEVDKIAERILFNDDIFTTVLTSATITSGNSYDYFIRNTAFPIKNGLISDPKESPFRYDEHAMIYYTESLPHPTNSRKEFIAEGVNEIVQLLKISNGKALILFTAKTDMQEVYEVLQKEELPFEILMQNGNSKQAELIRKFKSDVNSILLGTGTFWEGISIEGVALSHLIIFKLPFPVREPIIDYKWSLCKDGLMEVAVPEMIIKLKQGIGRLIRNETDKGIVSIIDSRIGDKSKAPYKNLIWSSLPIKNRTNSLIEIENFYKSLVTKQ
jgi:ATP-dependent DNA helicase DinG